MNTLKNIFTVFTLLSMVIYAQPTNVAVTTSGNQRETAITVDPNNPDHLMATWNNFYPPPYYEGYPYSPGWGFSTDGGNTWSIGNIDIQGFDPSCAIDDSGRAYYTHIQNGVVSIDYTTDDGHHWTYHPVSYSTSYQDKPYMAVDNTGGTYDGRLYVAWNGNDPNSYAIKFAYSDNQGVSWSEHTFQT